MICLRSCAAFALWLAVASRGTAEAPPTETVHQAHVEAARRSAWQRLAPHVKRPSDIPPAARQELRVHGRRMARLARVRALAESAHDRASVQRADKLIEREQTRHRAALTRVWPAATDARAAGASDDEQPERRVRAHEEEEEAEGEP